MQLKKANVGCSELVKYSTEFLRGWFSQHLQHLGFHGLANITIVTKCLADLRDIPSQELAVFGWAILEDIDDTCLPRFRLRQYIRGP